VADGHPYGRLPQGTDEGVRAIDRASLVEYHREGFRPDEAHLAIVGDFDEEAIVALLEGRFGRLPRPETAREPRAALSTERRERTIVETRPEKAQAKILYGGPGWTATDPDRLAGVAMNHILGGSSIRSRLGDEIRDKAGLAYSVYSRNWERSVGGFFSVHMGTRPENVRRSVDAIRAELARIAEGVTETELGDARDYLTGSFPLRFTTYGQIARFRARASFYGWPDDYLLTFVDRVRALTTEDVKRVAERIFGSSGVLAVAGPVGEDLTPTGA
jgi:zinc protease